MAALYSAKAASKPSARYFATVVVLLTALRHGEAKLVVIGDSYSDIGNGANTIVSDDLGTSQVLHVTPANHKACRDH